MRIGALMLVGAHNGGPAFLSALGPALEVRGFESIWIAEHVVLFDEYSSRYPYATDGRAPFKRESGLMDPFLVLGFLAASTTRLRLGTGVCLAGQRNPVYTAKHVADLDVLSGGRVDFGVGLGWLREEYEAVGVPWARRGDRMDEYLAVMRTLWTDEVSSHTGPLFTLPGCRMYPKPVQRPHPPVHIGGESDFALRRVARHGDGWFGLHVGPKDLEDRLEHLDAELAAAGRSRGDIEISVGPPLGPVDRAMADRYAALGVDRLIVTVIARDAETLPEVLDPVASELIGAPG